MSNGSISVLHVAETMRGGVGSYLSEVLRPQVDSLGTGAVSVIAPRGHLSQLEQIEGVELVSFDDGRGRLDHCIKIASAIRGRVRSRRVDIIHAHSAVAGVATRAFARLGNCGVPVVYCAHGWAFDRNRGGVDTRLIEWFERVLSYRAARVICISEFDRSSGARIGIPQDRLITVPNGIAMEPKRSGRRFDWPEGVLRVVFVGRFDRQKGVDVAARALELLNAHAFAYFIGDSVVGDQERLSLPPNVRALGWLTRADIAACLETADVAIIPSRWEGFGLVAVEAMRAGTAVLATKVGGLAEIVQDGLTGQLLPPESPEAFAAALRSLDRETLRAMGNAGRLRFREHFCAERMNAKLLEIYREVLSQCRRRGP